MTVPGILNQVNVLISTYNGKSYLLEQLESLYQQTHSNIKIIVRDDGSIDSTLKLLQDQASHNKLILHTSDTNLGPAASFFRLLETSGDAGFYAFCDQDDIWDPDKVEVAVSAISKFSPELPVMYFSRLTYVDSENNFIKFSPIPKALGFGNALVENVATGCTVVMNKAARDLIVKNLPTQCLMHDSWCYLLVSCLGELVFDSKSHIHYRQHSSNAIGASTSVLQTIHRRLKRFQLAKSGIFRFSNQAENFLNLYSNLIPENKRLLLQQFVDAKQSFKGRVILALSQEIWRQNTIDNFILRLLILINRY